MDLRDLFAASIDEVSVKKQGIARVGGCELVSILCEGVRLVRLFDCNNKCYWLRFRL